MTDKEKIEVMQACIDGKKIQCRPKGSDSWKDSESPAWEWLMWEYRIKPQSKLRPFTYEEALQILGKVVVSHKYGEKAKIVTSCFKDLDGKVQIFGITAEQFLNEYTFLDGKPCGVEE